MILRLTARLSVLVDSLRFLSIRFATMGLQSLLLLSFVTVAIGQGSIPFGPKGRPE